jgi:hypothetical protein
VVTSPKGHKNVRIGPDGIHVLDHGMLATLVERWHREINSFHMPSGEMIVTLDIVHCLLHLPIQGRMLNYKVIPTKTEGVELMMPRLRGPKVHMSGLYI